MSLSEQQKKILNLLADGRFHSGSALADILNISRSAVWKHLHDLTEFGLKPIAVSGKGYRLEWPIEFLDRAKIESSLLSSVRPHLTDVTIHDRLDSTNSYLSDLSQRDPRSGLVCIAEYQTAGKGRRGRSWVSPFGCNLYLSLIRRFQCGPAAISGLSLAVGVSVVRTMLNLKFTGIGLKWPNDIYWQGRKLGGILIEISGEAHGPCAAIIGIGLNVSLPNSEAKLIDQEWTDLERINEGRPISRNLLTGALLNELLPVAADFEIKGLSSYLDEWRSYDCLLGQPVRIFHGHEAKAGKAGGIDDNGLFRLIDREGKTLSFASGEISFRKD